ncbi:class F sortase [Streptomyces niveus]|uniref:class F sortase n=1 Tax=Streptomyces niveus TaxID=193462 RepID=UPI0036D253F1
MTGVRPRPPPDTSLSGLAPVAARPSGPSEDDGVRPTTLSIPSLRINSGLERLGLASDGTLNPPRAPQRAGWFEGGPLPGRTGPAVVVGHADSVDGPAVFADLSLLRRGDVVTVGLSDGGNVRFEVYSVERHAKDRFPTEAVYGPRPDPQLRLITCGGTYTDDGYEDNVIVYARLAPTDSAGGTERAAHATGDDRTPPRPPL